MIRNKLSSLLMIFGFCLILIGFWYLILYFIEYNRETPKVDVVLSELERPYIEKQVLKKPKIEYIDVVETTDEVTKGYFDGVTLIENEEYIGYIDIPSIEIKLPILRNYSESALNISPTVYKYDLETNQLIIGGHNYKRHFSKLKNVSVGEQLSMTNSEGDIYTYEILEILTLDGYDVDALHSLEYDLILFTCTLGGSSRLVVCCNEKDV